MYNAINNGKIKMCSTFFITVIVLVFLNNIVVAEKQFELDPFTEDIVIKKGQIPDAFLPNVTANSLKIYFKAGQIFANVEFDHNEELPNIGIHLNRNSLGFFRFNTGPLPKNVLRLKKASMVMLKSMEVIQKANYLTYKLSPKIFIKLLYKKEFKIQGFSDMNSNNITSELQKYRQEKYRTYDGTFNNLEENYSWGRALNTFSRLISAHYEDGIYKPAKSVLGFDLPSPRDLSLKIFNPQVKPDSKLSLLASEIAQIIAHDTNLAIQDNIEKGPIKCCTVDGKLLPDFQRHSSCMPISIPKYDPIYGQDNREYLPFVRTVTGVNSDGSLGPGEQINGVSSFLDCNFLYGNSKESSKQLRTFEGGTLIQHSINGKHPTLPLTNASFCDCRNGEEFCYKAGDTRVNQNPHLIAMHVIFLREHNRIAKVLKTFNSHWNDERLFQETRRIVIAVYQKVIYKEYLPLILGESFTNSLFDNTDKDGFTQNYDPKIDPTSLNSMSIVFRCFHSTIPESIICCNNSCHTMKEFKFSDYLLRPVLCCHNYDGILNSFSCRAMMKLETAATPEITDKLFKSKLKYGLDLFAMDIQRGRDHGIPSYNRFRQICGLKKARRFEDLIPDMGIQAVNRLKRCYKHVDDIDLLIGGMSEKKVPYTEFGPVILHIIREQFYRYMVGDRFFYSHKNEVYSFTKEQLHEIENASIAKLICDNGNNINEIQKNPFEIPSNRNPRLKCTELLIIDLSFWKEIYV